MRRTRNPNLAILERAVAMLGPLADQMVFVGGCATGLLLSDPAAPDIRETYDVDAIVEVGSLSEYHRLAATLRKHGFKEDQTPAAPICRWTADGVLLDIMPTEPAILGFGSPWYAAAMRAAERAMLPSGNAIRLVAAPHFLLTKLTAFDGRGRGDYVMSHDVENFVAVLDGRPELVDEVRRAEPLVRDALRMRLQALLDDPRFLAALPGHLPGDSASQAECRYYSSV